MLCPRVSAIRDDPRAPVLSQSWPGGVEKRGRGWLGLDWQTPSLLQAAVTPLPLHPWQAPRPGSICRGMKAPCRWRYELPTALGGCCFLGDVGCPEQGKFLDGFQAELQVAWRTPVRTACPDRIRGLDCGEGPAPQARIGELGDDDVGPLDCGEYFSCLQKPSRRNRGPLEAAQMLDLEPLFSN